MNYQGPGRYRHYKWSEYEVLGLALREDSIHKPGDPVYTTQQHLAENPDWKPPEDGGPGQVFVIYCPLTPGSLLEKRQEDFWARELDDFNAVLGEDEGTRYPRFELMGLAEVTEGEKSFSETQISEALRVLEGHMKNDQACTVWALFTILEGRHVRAN